MISSTRDLLAEFSLHLQGGDWPKARHALRSIFEGKFTLADLQNLLERAAKEKEALTRALPEPVLRVALLGGYTTQPVRVALESSTLLLDRRLDIYEANYNSFRTEILDPSSGLYAFKPQFVLIATGSESVEQFPSAGDSPEKVEALLSETIGTWTRLWQTLRDRTGAQILQHNFPLEAERPLGRLENRYVWTRSSFLRALDAELWKLDGTLIRVLDVADLADRVGQRTWTDLRWRHHSKHGFNPALIGEYTRLLSGTLRAVWGISKKCLVLDLDNTLWGGVIGDDGLNGIQLGMDSVTGEGFHAFCSYLKELGARGVLLAVSSRNETAIAEQVFTEHPSMPLKRGDFAAFVCNWESKAANLRTIASELNLGLNSLVFLDDEPAICAEIRTLVPEVTVVEMSGDPSSFARKIDSLQLFDSLGFTTEDSLRTQSYAGLSQQREQAPDDLESFLQDLRLKGSFQTATSEQLGRIEQLLLKTNQFNLTGKKWGVAELQEMLTDASGICIAVQIQDRYANYGLVSAVIGQRSDDTLEIENWVLSCRVFSKTVEAFILNSLFERAKALGCDSIRGMFIPSAKNSYARSMLEQLGAIGSPSTDSIEWRVSTENYLASFVETIPSEENKL